jgi:hypothetical protein
MTRRGVSWVSIALLALVIAGCGASADASADASDGHPTAKPGSTTTVAPTTTTTVPPPYSFDGSVPPPKLINTGTDYEAIYRSLSAYATWLLAHNPNSSLLPDAYVIGTPVFDRFKHDIETARTHDIRLIDVNDHLDISVAGSAPPIVSLLVTEYVDKVQMVSRGGTVTDEGTYSKPLHWLATLHLDGGIWRIASVELAQP